MQLLDAKARVFNEESVKCAFLAGFFDFRRTSRTPTL